MPDIKPPIGLFIRMPESLRKLIRLEAVENDESMSSSVVRILNDYFGVNGKRKK